MWTFPKCPAWKCVTRLVSTRPLKLGMPPHLGALPYIIYIYIYNFKKLKKLFKLFHRKKTPNPLKGQLNILYIKTTVVFVCVGSAWKIFSITARSLWSLYINSPSLSVCLWHDVLLQKHFLWTCQCVCLNLSISTR